MQNYDTTALILGIISRKSLKEPNKLTSLEFLVFVSCGNYLKRDFCRLALREELGFCTENAQTERKNEGIVCE
jgi:hypothetical protein